MTETIVTSETHPLASMAGPIGVDQPRWRPAARSALETRQAVAIALMTLGMIGVVVAWFGISGTLDPGKQMPFLASGGIGGAALIAIGVMVYVSHEHVQDRAAIAALLDRLDAVEAELRHVADTSGSKAGSNGRRGDQLRPERRATR